MTDQTRQRLDAINNFPHEVLTPDEAATLLGLSVTELLQKARRGEIPAATIGRQWRFRKVELEPLVAERQGGEE